MSTPKSLLFAASRIIGNNFHARGIKEERRLKRPAFCQMDDHARTNHFQVPLRICKSHILIKPTLFSIASSSTRFGLGQLAVRASCSPEFPFKCLAQTQEFVGLLCMQTLQYSKTGRPSFPCNVNNAMLDFAKSTICAFMPRLKEKCI